MKSIKRYLIKIIIKIILLFYNKKIITWCNYALDRIYTLCITHYLRPNDCYIYIERFSSFLGLKYIKIGSNSHIHKYCRIEAIDSYENQTFSPEIIIGNHVEIGEYNHITAIKRIIIGDGVLTGRRVTISDNNHGLFNRESLDIKPAKRDVVCKGEVIIGENVWIGENACILSGVSIGKGCVIAANAVVTKNIPDYSLVAGVPALIVKKINI